MKDTMDRNDDILTVREAALYLKVAEGTIRRWCTEKKIPFLRAGSRLRFRREELYNLGAIKWTG